MRRAATAVPAVCGRQPPLHPVPEPAVSAEYDAAHKAAMDRYVRRMERVRQGVELVLQVVRRPCGHLDYAFDQEQADGLRKEMCSCDGEKLHPGQERLPADPELVGDVNRTIREGLAHWLRGNCLCGAPLIGAQEREAWECAACREADGPASGEPAESSEPDPVTARYERRRRPEPPEKEEPIRLRWPPEKREKPES